MLNPIRQHHTFLDFAKYDEVGFDHEEVELFESEDVLVDLFKNNTLRDGSTVVGVHVYALEDSLFPILATDRGAYLEIQGQEYSKPLEELESILLTFLLSEGYEVGLDGDVGALELDGSGFETEKQVRGLLFFLIHGHGLALHPDDRLADSTLADELEPGFIELLDSTLEQAVDRHGLDRLLELTAQIRPDFDDKEG